MSFKGYNVDGTPGFTADAAALTEINAEADGFKLVAIRNASNVPVRTNAHTIIKMNLYKAYSCTVTIVDELIEETLELLENLLLHRRVRFEVVRSLHLFERALFLFIERFRHIDTDVDE